MSQVIRGEIPIDDKNEFILYMKRMTDRFILYPWPR
jgi:hypothetical protein